MMKANDPLNIDLTGARIAAHVTSEGDGNERWTELSVLYLDGFRRPWIAEACGCTDMPGEVKRRRVLASASLEKALRLFDETDLGIIVKENAREWADEEGVAVAPHAGVAAACDREALALLFGVDAAEVSINAAAKALEMGESTLRMAINDGRDIRVPLRRLLPFIDRAAFQRVHAKETARG